MTISGEYTKKSITIPTGLYQAVESRTTSGGFSSYVAVALQRQVEQDNLADLVADLEAVHGPVSPEELELRVQDLTW
ncbi:MAG: hypothetical protein FWF02_05620 [Micrococcales bacterium]|nr:hypothetical protein [Micrococcales bacterium]MCL2667172.1 hypothetical protein [Micrococcales bacterium]